MSAYDTIVRLDRPKVWVRVYCETPMDLRSAVYLSVEDDLTAYGTTVFMDPDEATRVATALLVAAQRARHAAVVDCVVAGKVP